MTAPLKGLAQLFGQLDEPRDLDKVQYPLLDLLFMTLAAVLCGANGWEDVATFAEGAQDWLGRFLDVAGGTPHHDVFRRTFDRLNPTTFSACFGRWAQALSDTLRGEVVAVDGKAVRGAFDRAARTTPRHLLHVWATRQRLLLHAAIVEGAPGEPGAIPAALRVLELAGAIVTGDANALTHDVTVAVREGDADYALALKGNRGVLHAQVEAAFDAAKARHFVDTPVSRDTTIDDAHGRTEHRHATAVPLDPAAVPAAAGYADARTILCVERLRLLPDRPPQRERHFDLTSLAPKAAPLNAIVRAHWGIESACHGGLDVVFHEDASRIRKGPGAANFAMIRRFGQTLLQRDTTQAKRSVAQRRKLAGWSPAYLTHLLTLVTP
jgi:predicted transposase YbfD/YdcC